MAITVVGIDGDDTIWHHGHIFDLATARIVDIISQYGDPIAFRPVLFDLVASNIKHFGYGVGSFCLSAIEAAQLFTNNSISGREIYDITQYVKELIAIDVSTVDGAHETLASLSSLYKLVLITKGQHCEQLNKIDAAGIDHYFTCIEIVHDKREHIYQRIIKRLGCSPDNFVMVGDSIRSDIIPSLNIGAWAIHIPHAVEWEHEVSPLPVDHPRLRSANCVCDIIELIASLK